MADDRDRRRGAVSSARSSRRGWGSPAGPWLWNLDLPKIDYPLASFYPRCPGGRTTAALERPARTGLPAVRRRPDRRVLPAELADLPAPTAGGARREPGPASDAGRHRDGARHAPAQRFAGRRRGRRPDGRVRRGHRDQARVAQPGRGVRLAALGPAPAGQATRTHPRRTGRRGHPVGHPGAGRSPEHVAPDRSDRRRHPRRDDAPRGHARSSGRVRVDRRRRRCRPAHPDGDPHHAVGAEHGSLEDRPVHECRDAVRPPRLRVRQPVRPGRDRRDLGPRLGLVPRRCVRPPRGQCVRRSAGARVRGSRSGRRGEHDRS